MSQVNGSNLMAAFNYTSKYARFNQDEQRRETWDESVDRMFDMHLRKYGEKLTSQMLSQLERVRQNVKEKKLLGSQRALQFGGKGVEKHNMRIYNCAVSYCDRPRFFAECFYMLLCGCGTGFSVQKHHVDQLPSLLRKPLTYETYEYKIEDTIEGWADSLDVLVGFYLGLYGRKPIFDYSQIRERGAKLSVGGTAPGPEPLRRALEKIDDIFNRAIANDQDRLRPIDCYDIVMHASDAVLSGGVRRSATIALFSPDDVEMREAKTGNWFIENPQRGRSNNSAVLVRSEDNLETFKSLMKAVREFGEPGFIFVDSKEYIYNPCVEIGMCPILIKDPNGNVVEEYTLDLLDFEKRNEWKVKGYRFLSGWQCCNLTEMNASVWASTSDAVLCAEKAAIIGTLQAGYTAPGYLEDVSRQIIERESLLGVSMTGMMDNPGFSFSSELQKQMAEEVVYTNKVWAEALGLRPAARTTCVKPAGNSSVLLSKDFYVASGVHPHHAKRLFRLVQVHKDDPVGKHFQMMNPHLVEESVWSANKTDNVITFPIETRPKAITKGDLTAVEFLKKVRSTQDNWVRYGTARPRSCEGLRHNVSNTCEVGSDEWGAVGRFIYENKWYFSGLSLLSKAGDFTYQQAPMQRVLFEDELAEMFGRANVGAAKHMKRHIDKRFGSLHNVMMPLKMVLEGYSTVEAVKDTQIHSELLWDTYKRIRAIIHVEHPDDILLLLASIGHEEKWDRLTSLMLDVDYTQLFEEEDITKPTDSIACGGPGGTCELDFSISSH